MSSLKWFALDRIRQFESQTHTVAASDFLFPSAKAALAEIERELSRVKGVLREATTAGDDVLVSACISANQKISSLTTYLGMILRSTNTRNGFEYYFSLNEIASLLTGNDERLILSSEWEYTPFYIPTPPEALSEFVFIGFPAYLSRNSLLMPLAAHELAHAAWRIKSLEGPVYVSVENIARNYFAENAENIRSKFGIQSDLFAETQEEEIFEQCLELIIAQSEELFCDLFGVNLFGESYVYALYWFIMPGFGNRAPSNYPRLQDRVNYVEEEAVGLGLHLRERPASPPDLGRRGGALVEIADAIVRRFVPTISKSARELASAIQFGESGDTRDEIKKNFLNRVPALYPRSPVEILIAAWEVYLDWQANAISEDERAEHFRIMNNLCLKSLESYEILRNGKLG